MTNLTNQTAMETIDQLGLLKAQIAELEQQEKLLKTRLGDLPVGTYEGLLYQLAVSEYVRETPDPVLKARIEELVEEHLNYQFVSAHTRKTDVRTLKVSARNGKAKAA